MNDFRGAWLEIGDTVALYYGYGSLEMGTIHKIKNNQAKVEVTYSNGEKVISKWKNSECMVKLND